MEASGLMGWSRLSGVAWLFKLCCLQGLMLDNAGMWAKRSFIDNGGLQGGVFVSKWDDV